MRRTALALAVLALAGCSSGHKAGTPIPSTFPASAASSVYLGLMRDKYPAAATAADDALLGAGRAVCEGFARGETWVEQVGIATRAGLSGADAGFTIGIAVGTLCPQYRDRLPS